MSEPRGQWLSVSEAAALLGTSPRTVRRQCAAGTLPARRVGGLWQVEVKSAKESDKSATDRAAKSDTDLSAESAKSDTGAANNRPNRTTEAVKSDTDLTAHLLEEVAFLRATVEQLHRDGAEVRAALRAALKLTAGESVQQLTPGTPTDGPQRAQSSPVGRNGPTDGSGAGQPAKRDGAALSYGDIADEIERSMNT